MIKYVKKVWGEEWWIVNEKNYCGKQLVLKKGFRCSAHHHKIKDETFFIIKGKVLMEYSPGGHWQYRIFRIMEEGATHRVEPGDMHRFTGLEDSEIIEFSTHHDDEDSYRLEESGQVDLVTILDQMERQIAEMRGPCPMLIPFNLEGEE